MVNATGGGAASLKVDTHLQTIMIVQPMPFGSVRPSVFFYHPLIILFTDWKSNAPSMTVQRGQNAHYVPSL